MKFRTIAGAAALLVLFSPVVMAAGNSTPANGAAQCASLAKQFDDAVKANASAPKLADAQKLGKTAASDCKAKHYAQGEKAYSDALNDLGVKPTM
jgi:hypothetical protein